MNQVEFSIYLLSKGISKKVVSDNISRLKRIERSIDNCDLDDEYFKDKCEALMKLFSKKGEQDEMKKVIISKFPIGSYQMNTFKYSIRKYVEFMDYKNLNKIS